jgi:hypothetical protein
MYPLAAGMTVYGIDIAGSFPLEISNVRSTVQATDHAGTAGQPINASALANPIRLADPLPLLIHCLSKTSSPSYVRKLFRPPAMNIP